MALIGGIECLVHLYSATHWHKRKRAKKQKLAAASKYPVFSEVDCPYGGLFVMKLKKQRQCQPQKLRFPNSTLRSVPSVVVFTVLLS